MLWCIRKPAVIMIVGVNGGGKTTSLGKALETNFLEWELKRLAWFALGMPQKAFMCKRWLLFFRKAGS